MAEEEEVVTLFFDGEVEREPTAEEAAEQAERDAVTAEEMRLQIIDEARLERNRRLTTETDPIITNPIRWGVLSAEKQAEWAAYRLALLAVPQQDGFPNSVTWPTKPE